MAVENLMVVALFERFTDGNISVKDAFDTLCADGKFAQAWWLARNTAQSPDAMALDAAIEKSGGWKRKQPRE